MIRPALLSRRLHKWLGLVIGIQALLWMVSGLYMTAISIDIIHGDHLVQRDSSPIAATAFAAASPQWNDQFEGITGIKLKRLLGREVIEVRHAGGVGLLDAASGKRMDPIDRPMVARLAQSMYVGNGKPVKIELLKTLPSEVGTRTAPLWRVDYDDMSATSLYISPTTGELVTRRHELWRIFDFMWMLHIMDYDTRDDMNNALMRTASLVGTLFALTSIWLLWFSFRRRPAK